jgi:predicted  nucleic acid-binding Zn-ribbon protein
LKKLKLHRKNSVESLTKTAHSTIEFPGDSLQIGDKVVVVTADDQRLDAPDGEHRLSDGTRIVTKDSVVEEIYGADGEKELSKEEMADVEDVIEEVVDAIEEAAPSAEISVEEIISEIADALKEEMKSMKTKMESLEEKVASLLDGPAAEPTILTPNEMTSKAKFSMFNVETAANADRIRATMSALKNKKK